MSTKEAFVQSFNTNVISVHFLTETMIDLLFRSLSPRIIFVSSGLGSMAAHEDPNYPVNQAPPAGWPKSYQLNNTAYRTSKAAMNMMALEWKRVLRNDNIKVNIITPGFSVTTLGGVSQEEYRKYGADEAHIGGTFFRAVIEGQMDKDEGTGIVRRNGVTAW